MFCNKCGKEIADGSKFCDSCGNVINDAEVKTEPVQSAVVGGMFVEHEMVQQKKWGTAEKVLVFIAVVFGFMVIVTFLGNFRLDLSSFRDLLVAGGFAAAAWFIHNKRPLTDHYKYKCPYCNEENTVAADETSTFKCSKCKKTMTIIDGKIKTLD